VHRTFVRQGLKPDAGLFQDAISASLERITADDFALLRRFDPGRGSIRAFLAVVGGSTASNSLRAARRHSGADLSAAEAMAVAPAAGGQKIAEVVPEGLLSDREGLVLRLTFERDMQGPDIARALDISENTVRVLKARALKKLRDAFIKEAGNAEKLLGAKLKQEKSVKLEKDWRRDARRFGPIPDGLFEVVRFKDAEIAH